MPKAIFDDEQTVTIEKELQQSFYQNDSDLASALQKRKTFEAFTIEQLKDKIVRVRGAMRKAGNPLNQNSKRTRQPSAKAKESAETYFDEDLTAPPQKKTKKGADRKSSAFMLVCYEYL